MTPRATAVSDLKDSDFDYFMLVRQWSGTFCAHAECPMVHRHGFKFTLHGLWPNYAAGGWPQDCNANMRFDESKLDDILPELQEEWPSVFKEDESFWAHEWSKHGTCALDIFPSELDYFKGTLDLHAKYDLQGVFSAAGITPSWTKTYRASDLQSAVEDAYGIVPQLHCVNGRLNEIWMCVGKDLSVIDCPSGPSLSALSGASCSDVIIPPLPSRPSELDITTQPEPSDAHSSGNLVLGMAATRTAKQQQQQLVRQQQQQLLSQELASLTFATSNAASGGGHELPLERQQQRQQQEQTFVALNAAASSKVSVASLFSRQHERQQQALLPLTAAAAIAYVDTTRTLPLPEESGLGLVVLSRGVASSGPDALCMMARLAALLAGRVEVSVASDGQRLPNDALVDVGQVLAMELGELAGVERDSDSDGDSAMSVDETRWEEQEEEEEELVEDQGRGERDGGSHHRGEREGHDRDQDDDREDGHGGSSSEERAAKADWRRVWGAERGEGGAERKAAEKADKKRAKREHALREERESHSQETDADPLERSDREQAASDVGSVDPATHAAVAAPTSVRLRLEVAKGSSDLNSARSASFVRITPLAHATATATPTLLPSTPDAVQSLSPLGVAAMLAVFCAVLAVLWVKHACCMAAARAAAAADGGEKVPPSSNRVWRATDVYACPNSHATYSVSRPLLEHPEARAPICN
ncbi:MAG: hypothetical protein WDW38_009843 [Sanguina aurantia]